MKTAKVFRGDSELMVDALISASQAKANTNGQVMPGYGRDLVPFFESDADAATLEGAVAQAASGYQPPYQGVPVNVRPAGVPLNQPISLAQPQPIPGKAEKRGRKRSEGSVKSSVDVYQPIVMAKSPPSSKQKQQPKAPAQPERWAGPAFSNSPAPAALPVPSFVPGPQGQAELESQPSGSQLLQLLQGGAPAQAAPAPVAAPRPTTPTQTSEPPNLLQALQAKAPEKPAPAPPSKPILNTPVASPMPAARPSSAPKAAAAMPLLTPEMLAKMVASTKSNDTGPDASKTRPSGALYSADSAQRLKSALSAPGVLPSPALAPKPIQQPLAQPPPAGDFQRLLKKLGTAA